MEENYIFGLQGVPFYALAVVSVGYLVTFAASVRDIYLKSFKSSAQNSPHNLTVNSLRSYKQSPLELSTQQLRRILK